MQEKNNWGPDEASAEGMLNQYEKQTQGKHTKFFYSASNSLKTI